MACRETTPYWSLDSSIYHVCRNCTLGDNIQPDKRKSGSNTIGRHLCNRCKDIRAGKVTR